MPGIDYTLGMKTAGFDGGVKGALGKLASIGAAAAKITAGIGMAAGAGAAALVAKSIGKAADMETMRTAFIPLLGGIQQAKDRMAELAAFARATPFELPEVAEANKNLQVMTQGALANTKGMTMVGDAAAFAGKSYADLSTWIGQLYAGLQEGGNAGDPLEQLTRIGVLTPQIKQQLAGMKDAGKPFAEMWGIAEARLAKFYGSMKLQATTWNGLMSDLSDTISAVMVKFGEPIMDALKPYLEGAISRIESFQAAALKAGSAIGDALGVLRAAFESGNLMALAGATLKLGFLEAVNTLAAGVRAAMLAGAGALQQSGVLLSLQALFEGIGQKLASVLQSAAGDIANSVGNLVQGSNLKDLSAASDTRAGNYFQMAKAGAEMFDPAATATAFVSNFRQAFASAPELIDTSAIREQYQAIRRPLEASAAADAVFREIDAEQLAASLVKAPGTTPAASLADAAGKATTGGSRPGDRLAQIGGYVGNATASMANKAAEQTARFTEKTATLLERMLTLTAINEGLAFR